MKKILDSILHYILGLVVISAILSNYAPYAHAFSPGSIVFSIQEGFQDPSAINEPQIGLSMATSIEYPCINYSIITTVAILDNNISVIIHDIERPLICLTAIGPATYYSSLDLSEGDYELNISWENVVDKYILTITDSSIEVVEVTSHFTSPRFNVFWRFPPNSFVYLCGTLNETSWICDDFLNILQESISLQEYHFPDYGRIPYPTSSSGHYYDSPARYFLYEREEDYIKAGEILESYARDVIRKYSGTSISLTNWKNSKYRSWIFRIYRDSDEDGYGDPNYYLLHGSVLNGFVENKLDCDDTDITVYSGASELCDGKDNDCDTVIPEDESDEDGDGYKICDGDSDDTNPTVYPGAPCEGDFDDDGYVDGSDLVVIAEDFGRMDCCDPDALPCEGDFDGDCDTDGSDLSLFAVDYGRKDCPRYGQIF